MNSFPSVSFLQLSRYGVDDLCNDEGGRAMFFTFTRVSNGVGIRLLGRKKKEITYEECQPAHACPSGDRVCSVPVMGCLEEAKEDDEACRDRSVEDAPRR